MRYGYGFGFFGGAGLGQALAIAVGYISRVKADSGTVVNEFAISNVIYPFTGI